MRRPWVHFEVFSDGKEKLFVSHDESALYTLKTSTIRNRRKAFILSQGLTFSFTAALSAFSKKFLEDLCNAALLLELYNMAEKNECEWSTSLAHRRLPDTDVLLNTVRTQMKQVLQMYPQLFSYGARSDYLLDDTLITLPQKMDRPTVASLPKAYSTGMTRTAGIQKRKA